MTAERIAIVGMAGRFPGAPNLDAFWRNLRGGVESITSFRPEELMAQGVGADLLGDPAYVPRNGMLAGIDRFDAGFFGFTPREAELTDPQHRVFLECAWEALENAGYEPLPKDLVAKTVKQIRERKGEPPDVPSPQDFMD